MLYILLYLTLPSSNLTRYVVAKLRSAFALQNYYAQACLSPITLVYDLEKHHLKADASLMLSGFFLCLCLCYPGSHLRFLNAYAYVYAYAYVTSVN